MKTDTKRITTILIALVVGLVALYFAINYFASKQNQDTLDKINLAIINQELVLAKISDLTRTNGADAVTERIIPDCGTAERQRFDNLLGSLSTSIKKSELTELNNLFYRCGSFYSDRKSVMAVRLSREVEIFSEYLTLKTALENKTTQENDKLTAWQKLAEDEVKTAEHFNSLVALQGKIIAELLLGKRADSPDVLATLNEVNNVRGQMLLLSKQIETNKAKALAI